MECTIQCSAESIIGALSVIGSSLAVLAVYRRKEPYSLLSIYPLNQLFIL